MKINALPIKRWIISHVSPFGWANMITEALPELLECNPHFSAFYINESTKWSASELEIISWYLAKSFDLEIPDSLLDEDSHSPLVMEEPRGISYLDNDQDIPQPSIISKLRLLFSRRLA